MGNLAVTKAVLLDPGTLRGSQESIQLALFNTDGTARVVPKRAAAQADFAGADLAALKVELNTFLGKLRTAGVIAT